MELTSSKLGRGQRLLPCLVDEIAGTDPSRVLYSIPKTQDPADGFTDVDARTFARAVNRCSKYMEQQLGRGKDFPTLTYMGPQDLVYAILILACIKTGYKLLLNSPRNTLEAHLSLFDQTECHTFLMPPKFPLPIVKQILANRDMRTVDIPGLQYWLEEGKDETYPYNKFFAEASGEPFVVLHTSGSTGLPKPIIQTHGTWSPQDAYCGLPAKGYKPTYPALCAGSRLYMSFPLFHCAGVSMILPAPIYCGFTSVLGPFPPSADIANSMHVHANVQRSCLVPTTLIDLVKDPVHLENLSRIEQITYGGGPCPQAVGDLVSTKTRLLNVLGSTEAGILPVQLGDPEDWAYMEVSPSLGSEYRHVSGDLYEHFVVRNETLSPYQGVFGTFPSLQEWSMKDLYSKHPTKENVWLYKGRADDIIVFANGEKFNPLGMEDVINADPHVSAALITGVGRFQSSLLVEAKSALDSDVKRLEILDLIWPSVQAANQQGPAHSRIHKNMVIFTTSDKPMLRAGKGTIQRKMTLDLYQNELDNLYASGGSGTVNQSSSNEKSVKTAADRIRHVISNTTDIDASSTGSSANLFELGLDSLQVTAITRELNRLLSSQDKPYSVTTRTVYSNPTIGQLTQQIEALIEGRTPLTRPGEDLAKMQAMYEQLRASLPVSAREAQQNTGSEVVLLTGSTGSLGSYILDSLTPGAEISEVFCLSRGRGSAARQKKSNIAKGLSVNDDKVHFFDCDYSLPYFGLPLHAYKQLLEKVTVVVHNAWQVDFNLSFESFAKQLQTMRQFVDFSAHSRFGAQILLISSISTVSNFGNITGSSTDVPEEMFNDWRISQNAGYGQSKLVAERLLDAAAREANVPATVCRVGQIAGPTTRKGVWPKQEWVPSLIASSKYLRKIPGSLGSMDIIDWIPVDQLGKMVVELISSTKDRRITGATSQQTGAVVYHLINPRQTEWAALVPTIQKHLCSSNNKSVEVVPLDEWVKALRQSATDLRGVPQNPAAKILEFFENLASGEAKQVILSTEKSAQASKTLANLEPITKSLIENWLNQWAF